MAVYDNTILPGAGGQKILLVGDINGSFLDSGILGRLSYHTCTNMQDAVVVAAKNRFEAIVIIISSFGSKLDSALRELKRLNPKARIILLAQMYEEPIALRFLHSPQNGQKAVDDYLICPVRAEEFCKVVLQQKLESMRPHAVSAQLDNRDKVIEQLVKLATVDELTGIKSRRYVREFFRQIIQRAKSEGSRVTLLVFDIDDFKHYNDVYGHLMGDKILKQAAILMQRCCRKHDVVGRIGGDEFAVVFWDGHAKAVSNVTRADVPKAREQNGQLKDEEKALGVDVESERRAAQIDHPKEVIFIAERFRKEFNSTELSLLGPGGKGVLTISGGLASFPRDGSTVQELFSQADKALLEAKRSGKNRIYLVGRPQNYSASAE